MEFNKICGFDILADFLKEIDYYYWLGNRDIADIDTRKENYLNIDIDKIIFELEKERKKIAT